MTTLTQTAAHSRPAGPNRQRFTLLVLLGVYPLITGISYAVAPLTSGSAPSSSPPSWRRSWSTG